MASPDRDVLVELLAKIDEARGWTDKLGAQANALGIANFAGRLDHVGCLLAEASVTVCDLRRQRADAARAVGRVEPFPSLDQLNASPLVARRARAVRRGKAVRRG